MTVDSTSLLVALKQKPHPSDAGLEAVLNEKRDERGAKIEAGSDASANVT